MVGARTNGVQGESSTLPEQYKGVELEERRQAWIAYRKAREKEAREKGRVRGSWERDLWEVSMEMARERDVDKGKGEEYSKQYSGLASSTVQQASKSGLSGEVQSQAGTAPHRTGIGRQTYASAARARRAAARTKRRLATADAGCRAEREGGVGVSSHIGCWQVTREGQLGSVLWPMLSTVGSGRRAAVMEPRPRRRHGSRACRR